MKNKVINYYNKTDDNVMIIKKLNFIENYEKSLLCHEELIALNVKCYVIPQNFSRIINTFATKAYLLFWQ